MGHKTQLKAAERAVRVLLAGWLLFWQSLILILLEGSSRDISTYLCQARTAWVDVDSYGRKVCAFDAWHYSPEVLLHGGSSPAHAAHARPHGIPVAAAANVQYCTVALA
jgi:hypothetical protein